MSVIAINKDNFNEIVMQSEKPVLLDFFATWCNPCRMLSPIVDELAEEREDIVVGKINVDEEMELAQKFGVVSIPTLVVIKNGEVASRSMGFKPKNQILDM
ncbi:MAG: thioredoxin, partial [Clostridia bacterium]|nr:thioredoxin [Clostridia bacterium]